MSLTDHEKGESIFRPSISYEALRHFGFQFPLVVRNIFAGVKNYRDAFWATIDRCTVKRLASTCQTYRKLCGHQISDQLIRVIGHYNRHVTRPSPDLLRK